MDLQLSIYIAFDIWSCILCIIAAIIVYAMRSLDKKGSAILISMLSIDSIINLMEIFACGYGGVPGTVAYYTVRIFTFMGLSFTYIVYFLAYRYILRVIDRRGGRVLKKLNPVAAVTACTAVVFMLLSRIMGFYYYFDESNLFKRIYESYPLLLLFFQILMILILVQILRNIRCFDKLNRIAFLSIVFLPIITTVVQEFGHTIPFLNIATTTYIMFFFFAYEKVYTNELVERESLVREEQIRVLNERVELDEVKIKLYSRQISPHFIYNSLASIRALCEEESEAAYAIDRFAGYLRSSSELITETNIVPVERELELVDNYLSIVKLRFGEKITVLKNLEDTDFSLPPFTIQILVENSVNHGIRHKPGGRANKRYTNMARSF